MNYDNNIILNVVEIYKKKSKMSLYNEYKRWDFYFFYVLITFGKYDIQLYKDEL